MTEESEGINELNAYIHYHECDYSKKYPVLVIQGNGVAGYNVDPDTLKLTRTCICAAHCEHECVCGYDDNREENEH